MLEKFINISHQHASTVIYKAYALNIGVDIPGTNSSNIKNSCDYINAVYRFALNAGFILAGLMILYAGYRYLTSQGNTTAINDAKDILIGAIIGFVILLLAKFIMTTLGLDTGGFVAAPNSNRCNLNSSF